MEKRKFKPNEIAVLSRLFSSTVIREFAQNGQSRLWAVLFREASSLCNFSASMRVKAVYEQIYEILKQPYCRPEYIYKSALANKILLGRHSLNTATMITEFRVQDRKADVVIINGTSTAYEIKSEQDRLDRLNGQLAAYKRVFAQSYVVTGENHVDTIIRIIPQYVGVLKLNKRFEFTKVREAASQPECIDVGAVFDSLRISEIRKILEIHGMELPKVPNTVERNVLKQIFVKLKPHSVHDAMIRTLHESRKQGKMVKLVNELPTSLRGAVISLDLRPASYDQILSAMQTTLREAQSWR